VKAMEKSSQTNGVDVVLELLDQLVKE